MAQQRPIRFTQRLGVAQFDRLQATANKLGVAKAEITRTALDKYLDELGSLRHEIRTPAA
jgi:predicted DNA-binding protein